MASDKPETSALPGPCGSGQQLTEKECCKGLGAVPFPIHNITSAWQAIPGSAPQSPMSQCLSPPADLLAGRRDTREEMVELSNLSDQPLFQGFGIKESFNEIPVGMGTILSRAQDPWCPQGWLTWRGDLVRHTTRWLLPKVPAPSMTSRRIRVLGTKLQERPRAGLTLLLSRSRVKWLVTCRKGHRSMMVVQRHLFLPLHFTHTRNLRSLILPGIITYS